MRRERPGVGAYLWPGGGGSVARPMRAPAGERPIASLPAHWRFKLRETHWLAPQGHPVACLHRVLGYLGHAGGPRRHAPVTNAHASFEGKRTCGKRTCGNKYCYLGHAHGRPAPRGARESVGWGAGAPRRPSSSAKTTLLWLPGAMQQRGSRDMGGGRGGKQRVNEIFGDMDFWIYQLKRLYRPIRPAGTRSLITILLLGAGKIDNFSWLF